jgi:hypothetical protein
MKTFSSACNKQHSDEDKESKFRKSLRAFLTFNLIIFIFMITGIGGAGLWKISIIWGAILAIKGRHYLKKEDCDNNDRHDTPSKEQYGRPRRPEWRDKDLV